MCKKLQILFSFIVVFCALCLNVSAADILYGDADGDGSITASDAASVLQYTLNGKWTGLIPVEYCDVDADGYIVPDREKVQSYVKKLAETYNTVGQEREFLTYNDRKIVVQGGDYGWVINEEAETDELINDILSGTIEVKEPVYSAEAGSRSSAGDLGLTYIEIDLSNQRLVYYEEGNPVIDTNIISGYPHEINTQTPTGTYAVTAKNAPGTIVDTGVTQSVYYLLEFNHGIPISDATWRTEFGGDVYYWEGTDGGIEVPLEDMDKLYQKASEGTAVVIYE